MSELDPDLSLDAELERSRGAERDLLTELLSSRRTAWRVATAGLVIAALAAGALLTLFPLKTPPILYAVRVDNAKGEIDHITRLGDAKEDYGDRMDRYFLHQYVLACESYDWYTIQNTYDRCGLFSAPSVQKAYYKKFQGDDSLDKVYGNHTRVVIHVRSITLGPKQSATVRFTQITEGDNAPAKSKQFIATLAYHYVNTPISESVGRDNPLGFQVVSYTTDIETVR